MWGGGGAPGVWGGGGAPGVWGGRVLSGYFFLGGKHGLVWSASGGCYKGVKHGENGLVWSGGCIRELHVNMLYLYKLITLIIFLWGETWTFGGETYPGLPPPDKTLGGALGVCGGGGGPGVWGGEGLQECGKGEGLQECGEGEGLQECGEGEGL